MAPPKATLRKVEWLDSPIANACIGAYILGRAFNRCRFHLRQAFLLYAGYVEPAASNQFNEALKILDGILKRDSEFAGKQWANFESALRRIRLQWTQSFGNRKHWELLDQLEIEMENCDGLMEIAQSDGEAIAQYAETLQQRDWDWGKRILRKCRLWLDELRTTLSGVIGPDQVDFFKLGDLLDQGVRPDEVILGCRNTKIDEGETALLEYSERYLFHRFGSVASQAAEQPLAKKWATDSAKLLRRIGLAAIAEDLKEPMPNVQKDRLVFVEKLSRKIQAALEARSETEASNDDGKQRQNDTPKARVSKRKGKRGRKPETERDVEWAKEFSARKKKKKWITPNEFANVLIGRGKLDLTTSAVAKAVTRGMEQLEKKNK